MTCHKLLIVFSAASTLAITTLDGTTTSLTIPGAQTLVIDCQFQSASWTASTATAVGFYRIDG
jgi:hypothetical protein